MARGYTEDTPPEPRSGTGSTGMHAMNEKDRQLRDAVIRQLEWDPQVTSNDISVAA